MDRRKCGKVDVIRCDASLMQIKNNNDVREAMIIGASVVRLEHRSRYTSGVNALVFPRKVACCFLWLFGGNVSKTPLSLTHTGTRVHISSACPGSK